MKLKQMIWKCKYMYNKYKRTQISADFENYKLLRNKIIGEICKSKQLHYDKLAENLRKDSIGQRDWWV